MGHHFNPWDEFVNRAKAYVQTGQLESQEINYKREIGQRLEAARAAVLRESEDWADLVKRGIGWQSHPQCTTVEIPQLD